MRTIPRGGSRGGKNCPPGTMLIFIRVCVRDMQECDLVCIIGGNLGPYSMLLWRLVPISSRCLGIRAPSPSHILTT